MTGAYQRMFTDFPAHLRKSDQVFTVPQPKCSIVGCDSPAEYVDLMDNPLCKSCMERDLRESDNEREDYERIQESAA